MDLPGLGHTFRGRAEQRLFGLRRRHVAQRGMGDALRVIHHRHGVAVELGIRRQVLRDDLVPFAETDQDVLADGDVALEEIRHRRRGDPQHRLRHRLDKLVGGGDGGRELAEEHRPVSREMIIVDAIAGIEIHRPGAVVELAVGYDGFLVPVHRVTVMAALDVDMRRHVNEVAHVGREFAQPVAGDQRHFGVRRHLHQMHMQMQQAGMAHRRRAGSGRRNPACRALQRCRRRAWARRSADPTCAKACD